LMRCTSSTDAWKTLVRKREFPAISRHSFEEKCSGSTHVTSHSHSPTSFANFRPVLRASVRVSLQNERALSPSFSSS
jgi:hypothetical protein